MVIADRIYQVDDALFDSRSDEEVPVTVARIGTRWIRFRVEGREELVRVRFPPGP